MYIYIYVYVCHSPVRVVPRQEHVLDDAKDAVLLEAQGLGAHDRRVDEVEAQRVGAVLVDDLGGVLVFLNLDV